MSTDAIDQPTRLDAAKKLYARLCDGAVLCQLHEAIEEVLETHFNWSLEDYVHSDENLREFHTFRYFAFLESLINGTDLTVDEYAANYIENIS